MRTFVLRRLLLGLVVLFGVTLVTFVIARVIPSDPAAQWVGGHPTQEQLARAREELGLDKPLLVQYGRYLKGLVQGDWGLSIRTKRPVLGDIATYLPASLEIVLGGNLLALLIGVPLGVYSATHKNRMGDHLARILAIGGVSLPTFWLALLLQLVFFKRLGWLPLGDRLDTIVGLTSPIEKVTGSFVLDALITGNWPAFQDALIHLILPVVCLTFYPLGLIIRMTRSSLLETMNEDHILVLRAYGLPRRTIHFRYALKAAIGPTITVLGLSFAYSLAETFLIETVFNWPGLGQYASQSILSADYPAIVGVTVVVATAYVIVNLVVDLVLAALDPRIRLEA